jgi:mitogen-activated protein kinase 1/3
MASAAPRPEEKAGTVTTGPVLPEYLSIVKVLGEGAYGQVFLCEDLRQKGTQVAVKWIKNFARDPLCGKRILREVRLLAALRHENLLKLIDLLPVPSPEFDDVYIVMQYMHLDLHRVIYSKMKLSESHSQAFICQILRGLKYLHSAGVVHRDLKPSNVLVNKDCTLRIADFGLARGRSSEEENLTDYVVTRWYRAPELVLWPEGYFEAVDLWSVGCIIAELQAREPLFPGKDHVDLLRRIADTLGFSAARDLAWVPANKVPEVRGMVDVLKLPEQPVKTLLERVPNASETCLDLMSGLLAKVPTERISAADAIAHPYLAHLHDTQGETTAPKPFPWDFDTFDPTRRNLKDRVYAECARLHPDIIVRDQEWLSKRGWLPKPGTAPLGPEAKTSTAPALAGDAGS